MRGLRKEACQPVSTESRLRPKPPVFSSKASPPLCQQCVSARSSGNSSTQLWLSFSVMVNWGRSHSFCIKDSKKRSYLSWFLNRSFLFVSWKRITCLSKTLCRLQRSRSGAEHSRSFKSHCGSRSSPQALGKNSRTWKEAARRLSASPSHICKWKLRRSKGNQSEIFGNVKISYY